MTILAVSISNDTLITVVLVLAIIVFIVWLLGHVPWRRG